MAQQQLFTLSGRVLDAQTSEPVVGAKISLPQRNVATDAQGAWRLRLPAGTYQFRISSLGYQSRQQTVDLRKDLRLELTLQPEASQLQEVEVSDRRPDANVREIQTGVQRLSVQQLLRLPALLGEVDLLRGLQLLPGVSSVGEGATGFNVRGGDVGQNLVLLDEAPIFNSSHLFGFFSVFNPDAVRDAKLLKGGIPPAYGGRVASILDVRLQQGDAQRFAMQGGLGLIFSRLTLSVPIVKDRISVIAAARRSYIDILSRPFLSSDLEGSVFNFYDLTFSVGGRIGKRDRLVLSAYAGRDAFAAGGDFDFNWGNKTASLIWRRSWERWQLGVTLLGSDYDYRLAFAQTTDDFSWKGRVLTGSLKAETNFSPNAENTLVAGLQVQPYRFEPGDIAAKIANEQVNTPGVQDRYALEYALYIGNEQQLGERWGLQYGLRYSWFTYMGKGVVYDYAPAPPNTRREVIRASARHYGMWEPIKTCHNPEPRLSLRYQLAPSTSIKASYQRMAQYIHLISNTTSSTPLDVWWPSTTEIPPQKVDQWSLGYFRNFRDNGWEFSAEGYYKWMRGQIEYVDGADLRLNEFLEGELLEGVGRAYGIEFLLQRPKGVWSGWLSYTLGRSERKVDGINQGRWFATRFDQTHNLKVVGTYTPTKKWNFSTTFTLLSGTPTTFFTAQAEIGPWAVPHNPDGRRNNQRIPTYHRLDLSAQYTPSRNAQRRWKSDWVFAIYNVYARRNAYGLYFGPDPNRPLPGTFAENQAVRFSVVGTLIPSVTYNFRY